MGQEFYHSQPIKNLLPHRQATYQPAAQHGYRGERVQKSPLGGLFYKERFGRRERI